MKMPDINDRVLQLVAKHTNKSVKKFAESINISQQTVNRLFNIDKRTNKYPTVTTEVLISIINAYPSINAVWLLTGKGEMTEEY